MAKVMASSPCLLARTSSSSAPLLLSKLKPPCFSSLTPRPLFPCRALPLLSFLPKKPLLPVVFSAPSSTISASSAPISVGDRLPNSTLSYLDKDGQVQTVSVADLTKGKKAVLFAVPGAFTPTCSQKHVPGFVDKADELRAKGVDTIACIAVNDAFVLRAWGESLGVGDKVLLLSDGNLEFTKAIGVTLDLSDKPVGLGIRSCRYSMLVEDGVVKVLYLEEGGSFTNSGAEDILKVL